MAIIVDACPAEAGWRYRLRDTQTARYVTDGTGAVEITAEIEAMMEWGGVQESPDANAVLNRWLNLARTRGSSDLSKKAVKPADRKWQAPTETDPPAGPLRYAIRSAAVAGQIVQGILDAQIAEWTSRLSPEAAAFLGTSFVIPELLRGPGTAVIRARIGSHAVTQKLVTEITLALPEIVSVETECVDDAISFVFRLR